MFAFVDHWKRNVSQIGSGIQDRMIIDPNLSWLHSYRAIVSRFSLFGLVVAPTFFAVLFYGIVASPRYSSETRFVVRKANSAHVSGLEILLLNLGASKTAEDAYLVQKYLLSRDVLRNLNEAGLDLKRIFSLADVDRLSRYPRLWRDDNSEALFDYYLDRVSVSQDQVKGILKLRVITFKPEDSRNVAVALVRLAEGMVNRMNERALRGATSEALEAVRFAEEELSASQSALTAFRNKEQIFDPAQSSGSIIETMSALSTELSLTLAELNTLRASSPSNPGLRNLSEKVVALEQGIKAQSAKIVGNTDSLSNKVSTYEQLGLRREIADKRLTAALQSLELSLQEARQQQIYLEQVVTPNLPDEATEPQRIRSILQILIVSLVLFSVIWILSVGAEEHLQ